MPGCDKIKLRASGFRLVNDVIDDMLVIAIVAMGKRARSDVYQLASERMKSFYQSSMMVASGALRPGRYFYISIQHIELFE
ncbi:hypothetical protein GCM10023078_26950 [Gibbsiella greigii]